MLLDCEEEKEKKKKSSLEERRSKGEEHETRRRTAVRAPSSPCGLRSRGEAREPSSSPEAQDWREKATGKGSCGGASPAESKGSPRTFSAALHKQSCACIRVRSRLRRRRRARRETSSRGVSWAKGWVFSVSFFFFFFFEEKNHKRISPSTLSRGCTQKREERSLPLFLACSPLRRFSSAFLPRALSQSRFTHP